ncbi:hypothetical protein NTJ56_17685 [Burkholderia contaminans]|uniref:hypothetical protein n=1 Tax=Burkholderia cepacia complex TaxID=87882 RepID=UPI000AB88750|nr:MULTISPECIES: hypothetical protein [Burkholderia cepacia complex]MCA7919405.1 hypothetical protein [Burkholderia contaminans]UUX37148.1 hypothetical protein NTJ56_17685 [Burkholderia contaminans]
MSRPLLQNPSPATARRRKNREAWRDARRFTGFSFEKGTYDRAKAAWQRFREQHHGTPAGQATFTDWVAASMIAFEKLSPDERAAHLTAYMRASTSATPTVEQAVAAFRDEIDAMWDAPLPLIAPPTPEPPHSCEHVLLFNDATAYRRRFAAFERGAVQPLRVRRWTVLRHVPAPSARELAPFVPPTFDVVAILDMYYASKAASTPDSL